MKKGKKIFLTVCTLVIAFASLSQSKGYGLLIGATKTFDISRFGSASVAKADKDAGIINDILVLSGFQTQDIKLLKGDDATANNVINSLTDFSKKVKKGDMFVFYFSGHGDTILDTNHDELPYTFDQRIILADGAVVDDALFDIFNKFKDSVRIIFIADACFSGEMYEMRNMFTGLRISGLRDVESTGMQNYNNGGCNVRIDSARFSMIYVGAVDRPSLSTPFSDGSGRLTRWIHDAWYYLKSRNLLEPLSMLDFFKQACFSSSQTIVTIIQNSNKDIFGKKYLFKL